MESVDLVKRVVQTKSTKEKNTEIHISNADVIKAASESKGKIFAVPVKLPMIVKPKEYGEGLLGGYLLNNVTHAEKLIIPKKSYAHDSTVKSNNIIYHMVNNLSATPFKINKELLDYITSEGRYLLLDKTVPHKYDGVEKLDKRQKGILQSYNSKVTLQEMILEIASFYSRFNEIYFPIRLDQRGRLYCTPNYFNYQSNELSKALILFSRPGLIHRADLESISYMKVYGANSFGGALSKKSDELKCD